MRSMFISLVTTLLLACAPDSGKQEAATGQSGQHGTVTEYLSVPGPIRYQDTDFGLKWSEHPNDNYYIQEYLPAGNTLEHFNEMLTIHLFLTDLSVADAADQKIEELEQRKQSDSYCSYQAKDSPDGKEVMLEFFVSQSGDEEVVEFNLFHYRQIELSPGQKALCIYAYSKRSYGADDIAAFSQTFDNDRSGFFNGMISLEKTEIQLK
ncbi:MAG: hypothetical protein H6561_18770 [Lewinellaceae bacterium]|nr:hypothetical protein [Lewinellaceae bacterium]HPR00175.1 hypothetical protein [Saprospiraceae bacterium]